MKKGGQACLSCPGAPSQVPPPPERRGERAAGLWGEGGHASPGKFFGKHWFAGRRPGAAGQGAITPWRQRLAGSRKPGLTGGICGLTSADELGAAVPETPGGEGGGREAGRQRPGVPTLG